MRNTIVSILIFPIIFYAASSYATSLGTTVSVQNNTNRIFILHANDKIYEVNPGTNMFINLFENATSFHTAYYTNSFRIAANTTVCTVSQTIRVKYELFSDKLASVEVPSITQNNSSFNRYKCSSDFYALDGDQSNYLGIQISAK